MYTTTAWSHYFCCACTEEVVTTHLYLLFVMCCLVATLRLEYLFCKLLVWILLNYLVLLLKVLLPYLDWPSKLIPLSIPHQRSVRVTKHLTNTTSPAASKLCDPNNCSNRQTSFRSGNVRAAATVIFPWILKRSTPKQQHSKFPKKLLLSYIIVSHQSHTNSLFWTSQQ